MKPFRDAEAKVSSVHKGDEVLTQEFGVTKTRVVAGALSRFSDPGNGHAE